MGPQFRNLILRKLYEYHWVESDLIPDLTNNFGGKALTHSNWNLTGRRISFVDASNEGMFAPLYVENRSSNPITRSTPTNILTAGINQTITDRLTDAFELNSDLSHFHQNNPLLMRSFILITIQTWGE